MYFNVIRNFSFQSKIRPWMYTSKANYCVRKSCIWGNGKSMVGCVVSPIQIDYSGYPRAKFINRINKVFIFMPPTLKKLKGHIAFGLSLRLFVRLLQKLSYSFEIS